MILIICVGVRLVRAPLMMGPRGWKAPSRLGPYIKLEANFMPSTLNRWPTSLRTRDLIKKISKRFSFLYFLFLKVYLNSAYRSSSNRHLSIV